MSFFQACGILQSDVGFLINGKPNRSRLPREFEASYRKHGDCCVVEFNRAEAIVVDLTVQPHGWDTASK
jgi:hypothetical protein